MNNEEYKRVLNNAVKSKKYSKKFEARLLQMNERIFKEMEIPTLSDEQLNLTLGE